MAMERFRRTSSPPERTRSGFVTPVEGNYSYNARKRPSIGRAAESFQNKLMASFRSVRKRGSGDHLAQGGSSPFFTAFFRLPNELHIHILCDLCISDLLALRRTSRALNELIAGCAPALVRFWVQHRMGTLHTRLYPAPVPNEANFQYLLTMRRRHIASVRLTRELANFVLRDLLQHTSRRQRQMWSSVYEKMIPLVFGVGYFLEEHRRVILERDLGRIRPRSHIGYDICTTPGITTQERAILKRLDPPLRLQFFYMYCFIVQVLARKLRPPTNTCAGSVERFLRGWSGGPACAEDIAFVLVLGGIGQVAKLLACEDYSERRTMLHSFITSLSPHESVRWRSQWRDVGVLSPALLDDIPCTSIGITQLDQIWEPLISSMMKTESREFTAHQKATYREVRASKTYINEIMGYDILRGRSPNGDDSPDDAHEDM